MKEFVNFFSNPLVLGILFLLILRIYYAWMQRKLAAVEEESEQLEKQKEIAYNFLEKAGNILLSGDQLEERLEEIGSFIAEALGADSGAIFLRHDENYVKARAIFGEGIFPPLIQTIDKVFTSKKFIKEKILSDVVPIREARLIGHVLQTGQSQVITDGTNDPRIPRSANELIEIKSLLIAPLRVNEKILGVCVLVNKRSGESFSNYDQSLFENLVNYAALMLDLLYLTHEVREKQNLQQEIQLANEVQQLLLPQNLFPLEGYDLYAYNKPAKELGGDYYEVLELGNNKIGVAIADVSGKGVAAALVMATLRSFIKVEAPRFVDKPKELVEHLNHLLFKDTKEDMFITLAYGVLDTETGVFKFARAGHEQISIFSPGNSMPKEYCPKGMAMGIVSPDSFHLEESSVTLRDEELLFLYTDGVTEAMNKYQDEFGIERVRDVVQANCQKTTKEICGILLEEIEAFTGGISQYDDITLVLIKRDKKKYRGEQ